MLCQLYVYIQPLLLGFPSHLASYPSRSTQSTELSPLCYRAGSHQLSILHTAVYTGRYYSPNSSHLPPPPCFFYSPFLLGGGTLDFLAHNDNKCAAVAAAAAAAAKSLQSCPTLCNPINGSPPGSPVPGILQARTLELVAIFFFNA